MAIYQAFAVPSNSSLANFQAWSQFFGAGFTTAGWVAQTGHGEVVASGTGASYAWTTVALPTTALLPPNAYTFKGAWVSGNTYVGGNSAALTTECDVVTSGGVTYQHITSTSSLTTAPGSDTTNWQPLIMEIWKSNGSNTASLPIYVKIIYTVQTSAGSTYRFHLSIGNGIDANGNLTNPVQLSATAPVWVALCDNATTTTAITGEMDFSGDADNFRFIFCRNIGAFASVNYQQTVVVDRSKTSSGTDSDAFVYVGTILALGATQGTKSSILLNAALGGGAVLYNSLGWTGVVTAANMTTSLAMFGSIPVFPIFPVVGYLANPLLGCVGVHHPDFISDGSVIPVWMYGTSHTYLASVGLSAATAFLDNGSGSNGMNPAILWE